jgi:hypothetical protein
MTRHRDARHQVLLAAALSVVPFATCRAEGPGPDQPRPLTITMEDCILSRPGRITSQTSVLRLLFAGPPTEDLCKRGTVALDGRKYVLYLPKAKAYSVKNSKPSDSGFENTSTAIAVDQDGDGKLTDWFANLPLRLGDKMFEVTEIPADGSHLVLKPSKAPLRGVILGRRCPDFSIKTSDCKLLTLDGFAGKVFLLDVWSLT